MKLTLSLLLVASLTTTSAEPQHHNPVESTGEDSELVQYLIPLPDTFVDFAEAASEDVAYYFKSCGIRIPEGGRIAVDDSTDGLAVKLPREEALRVIQLVNCCIEYSPIGLFAYPEKTDPPEMDANMQFPIPNVYKDQEGISLHVEKRSGNRITCLIVNNTSHSVWFPGWNVEAPFYKIQELRGDRWFNLGSSMGCGTYIRTPQLMAQRACRFELSLPKIKMPVRIGIRFGDYDFIQRNHNSIWTSALKSIL